MKENQSEAVRLATGLALVGGAALAVHSLLIEPSWVEVSYPTFRLPDLPPFWEGRRVVHLTDLHYGNPRSEPLFRWMVNTVNQLDPDLILITGDFIQDLWRYVEPCVRHLAGLRSRFGVVGVLGDHDFKRLPARHVGGGKHPESRSIRYTPIGGLAEALDSVGIRILRNESVELEGGLRLAGVDPKTERTDCADLEVALACSPATPHLLLSHSPDLIGEASARGIPAILAGHTHGGQVVVPFYGPPVTHTHTGRAHASGWSERGRTQMYTTRGLTSHYSLRLFCRPEIAVFELHRPADPWPDLPA
jgi:predicted MPP superfamily phosphohydrolase